ncbi:MAG: leucyl/phenylalanyl-tRNA--protein transferase [Deltaproteobacteria bacterium]|nr:leucyl/phenylalanyl-tRNA--protein transferase [Deltaproteobacteria bacterium]
MPIYRLDERLAFPPPSHADPDGLLAVGGDLRSERVLLGYASGIFPWPERGYPLLWHSPDPRYVLPSAELHVPSSLRRVMNRGGLRVSLDEAFAEVIERCACVSRPGQRGTWITPAMLEAYVELHHLGYAHSVEVRLASDGGLVGGLYGVSLGGAFFGESMFADAPDASKVGFVTLVRQLAAWGIELVDAQVHTAHLERFGARPWPRARYLAELDRLLERPTRVGTWRFDPPASRGTATT